MRKHYTIKIDSTSYLLKDFFLADKSTLVQNQVAWKLNCNKHAMFFLQGYLTYKDSCVQLLQTQTNTKGTYNVQLQKLFSFNAQVNDGWNVLLEGNQGGNMRGDSIVYRGKYPKNGELLYAYSIFGFDMLAKSHQKIFSSLISFRIEVSFAKGIRNIEVYDFGQKYLLYVASLYPSVQVIDTGRGRHIL